MGRERGQLELARAILPDLSLQEVVATTSQIGYDDFELMSRPRIRVLLDPSGL